MGAGRAARVAGLMDLLALLQERERMLKEEVNAFEQAVKAFLQDHEDRSDEEPVLTEAQLQRLYWSTLYEVDSFPLIDFLKEQYVESDWDETLLLTLHSMAIPSSPEDLTGRFKCLSSYSGPDAMFIAPFFKRQKSTLGLTASNKTSKVLADLIIVRHFEVALLLLLVIGQRLEQCHEGFKLKEAVEQFTDAISIHYAIDIKPSQAFCKFVQTEYEACVVDVSLSERISLLDMIVDACGLELGSEPPSEEPSHLEQDENLIPATQSQLVFKDSSTFRDSSTLRDSFRDPFSNEPKLSQKGTVETISPITFNSHWSRLKSTTLHRRSTDTDLHSRIIDLPPMPPRLSSQASQTTVSSKLTPKRKGVLVHVGDISPSKKMVKPADVMAWETPVKKRRAPSSQQAFSLSQSTATQISDITANSFLVLETPPRPSLAPLDRLGTPNTLNLA